VLTSRFHYTAIVIAVTLHIVAHLRIRPAADSDVVHLLVERLLPLWHFYWLLQ
jgi:hypothetical protein